jgi:hypothetical protein
VSAWSPERVTVWLDQAPFSVGDLLVPRANLDGMLAYPVSPSRYRQQRSPLWLSDQDALGSEHPQEQSGIHIGRFESASPWSVLRPHGTLECLLHQFGLLVCRVRQGYPGRPLARLVGPVAPRQAAQEGRSFL